jgi:hypothetical protein
MATDIELASIINYLQSIKQDLHKRFRPELIDITKTQQHPPPEVEANTGPAGPPGPKTYFHLIQKQRNMMYRGDYGAQRDANKREHEQETFTGESLSTTGDPYKQWNKLPNNMKIQAMLTFIDRIVPKLSDEQKNQLRFLLISSISQKKLSKQSDVDYDATSGQIIKIHRLSLSENGFIIYDENTLDMPINFPFTTVPPTPVVEPVVAPSPVIKKKLILIKK